MAHEGAGSIDRGDGLDAIFGALDQEIESGERSRDIGADAGEFAGERGAVGGVTVSRTPEVGNFVGEKSGVGRREARDRGFSRAGNAGEEKSATVANRAGGVNQEAALLG